MHKPRLHCVAWLLCLNFKNNDKSTIKLSLKAEIEVYIMKIGTHFDDYEFACGCHRHEVDENGHNKLDHIIDKRLVDLLDAIRERLGVPLTVTSGYRCEEHNEEVGGVSNSQHVLGTAADITYDDVDVEYLAEVAEACGQELGIEGGIGTYYYQGFVHVDVRGYAARWNDLD